MPIASIIIPCYNHGRFVDEAVDSALAQTCGDLEILVVNDGSTDPATNRHLENYERPRTRVLHPGKNLGKAGACNFGIQEARGEYILVLDADDRIGPTYLEQAARVLADRPGVGIVSCEADYFGTKSGRWHLPEYSLPLMLVMNLIHCTAWFRRRDWETTGGMSTDILLSDWEFWLKLVALGRDVVRLPDTLFFYRRHWATQHHISFRIDERAFAEDAYRIALKHKDLYARHPEVLLEQIRDLKLDIVAERERAPHRRVRRWIRKLLGRG